MTQELIKNVADTARWMATYRAWESERPDSLFSDPLAARFVGTHGASMAALAPRAVRSGWPVAVRTRLIDDAIVSAVRAGCDCVLNLGAGFDTRPYRLPLPEDLTWIEVDAAPLLDEKERVLADARPVCRLLRERVNVAERRARAELLDHVQGSWANVVVISEGLVVYLADSSVRTLAVDLATRSAVRTWLVDFFSPAVLKMMRSGVGRALDAAPLKFAPANGVAFFEPLGWSVRSVGSIFREGAGMGRAPFLVRVMQRMPEPDPRNLKNSRWAAVVQLSNDGTAKP